MFDIAEYTRRTSELKSQTEGILRNTDIEVHINRDRSNAIKIVFAGQYSAGKSSILKMLTGREDIAIDAGITTQKVHTYNWQGIEVVDTPGIHTQLRPDHDEISYNAIASADMLVFVITNELFDSYIADHFRKLAIDKDKAGEMILVVNKMDRTSGGNTPEQQAIIAEDLKKVIEPYTPEDVRLSFLDAKSYLESVEERSEDPDYADELLEQSGYEKFIDTLNSFVEDKKLTSRLTTDLYVIDDCLERAIRKLQPESDDADIDALEENFLQQRHILIDARGRIQSEIKDIFTVAASKIRETGLDAANLLVEGCSQAEVEHELNKYVRCAEDEIEKCQEDAKVTLDARLNELGKQLDVIENSEFSVNLKTRLTGKFDGLPEGIKKVILRASPELQKAGKTILDSAYKTGVQGGLKLTSFSGSSIHQMVLNIGHTINFKFAPWQAIKITRGIAIGGQVLGVLGVALSVFMQIKSDQDENRIREDLRKNRQNVRSQFNSAADQLEDFARQYINDNVYRPLNNSIKTIDDSIQGIRDTRTNRNESCHAIENLQQECHRLIQEIHAEKAMVI